MLRLPEFQATLKAFTWGRLEADGSFCFDIAKARFNVLGNQGMGYWSTRGGFAPYQNTPEIGALADPQTLLMAQNFKHLDGYDLLHLKDHLTDKSGWKLDPELIPHLDISLIEDSKKPTLVTHFEGGVKDWDSWYAWRKLPKRSPAALLMSFPLSVYQLMVHTIRITDPGRGKANQRVSLCVHVLGAEQELNFLPLYVAPTPLHLACF